MEVSELVTKADIAQLREDIFEELRKFRFGNKTTPIKKEWLKSFEVCEMLSISKGTLASYRRNGTLRYSKIGGLIYYKHQDIETLMNNK
ncbi:helix-turn-helix domain-containing protein [Pedobacter psychrotolerans]|jgi:hypothetical protein|uniref:helix-turn-helix domain-containing protein n=1 Tax=Pedobacter psychrotolerans TaxID=1843235 RepID=UPI003F964761